MRFLLRFVFVLLILSLTKEALAQENKVVVIPLSTTEMPKATPETLVSASGEWTVAGLIIPSMIIKDLIFYVQSSSSVCQFSMNYVINNIQSRTIRRFSLSTGGSVQISFGAGVNSSDLRFGTISGSGGTCIRNWAAFGVALP